MEFQFEKQEQQYLRLLPGSCCSREQTQEVKLPESMPDVGRVIAAWGQLVIRSKEWQMDRAVVSCGVMAWVLYAPEDGSPAQWAEAWLPMQMQWQLPENAPEGQLICRGTVQSVDARAVSGRRLVVRATGQIWTQLLLPQTLLTCTPLDIPESIQLLQTTCQAQLLREAGERVFTIDEELAFPDGSPAADKAVYYTLCPQVEESKLLGDKLVFRGKAVLHLMYRTQEGALAACDWDVPFSQYAQLDREYGHGAAAWVEPILTTLEIELRQGTVCLKATVSGQYALSDTVGISVTEDAYSPAFPVELQRENMPLYPAPACSTQSVSIRQDAPFESSRVVDAALYTQCPERICRDDGVYAELTGVFRTLYYDMKGVLQAGNVHWQDCVQVQPGHSCNTILWNSRTQGVSGTAGADTTTLSSQLSLESQSLCERMLCTVTALTTGDAYPENPDRPSIIVCRAGEETIWDIAKRTGTTVAAIREANALNDEAEKGRLLLIPLA